MDDYTVLLGEEDPIDAARRASARRAAALRGAPKGYTGSWTEPPVSTAPAQKPPVPVPASAQQVPPPQPMLPRAMGRQGPPASAQQVPQGPPQPDPLMDQQADLQRRQRAEMQTQERANREPDYAGMEAYGRERQQQGGQHLLMALAAQEAGMQPMQAHFLKQASAARDPMKVTGGTITEGGFLQDPGYAQELELKRSDARMRQLDTAIAGNITAQERRRLEAEKAKEAELARNQRSEDFRYGVDERIRDREAAREVAGLKPGKLTDKARADIDEHNAMAAGLGGAVRALSLAPDEKSTGWLAGLVQEKLPGGESLVSKVRGPEMRDAIQQLTYVTDGIRHGRFGSALTITEKASAAQYLPSAYDDRGRLLEKAKGLQSLLQLNHQRLTAHAAQAGPGPTGATTPAAAPGQAPVAPPGPPRAPVAERAKQYLQP